MIVLLTSNTISLPPATDEWNLLVKLYLSTEPPKRTLYLCSDDSTVVSMLAESGSNTRVMVTAGPGLIGIVGKLKKDWNLRQTAIVSGGVVVVKETSISHGLLYVGSSLKGTLVLLDGPQETALASTMSDKWTTGTNRTNLVFDHILSVMN